MAHGELSAFSLNTKSFYRGLTSCFFDAPFNFLLFLELLQNTIYHQLLKNTILIFHLDQVRQTIQEWT